MLFMRFLLVLSRTICEIYNQWFTAQNSVVDLRLGILFALNQNHAQQIVI